MSEALFFLAAFVAEVIGTTAGFGSSTIFLPIALFFVDFRIALVLVAVFHLAGNLGRVTFFRHGLDRRLLLVFGVPSVASTVLGSLLVALVFPEILKLVLGVFLIGWAAMSLARQDFVFPATTPSAAVGGGVSGFLAGLVGTGGALRGAFLTAFGLPKEVYIATAASIALAVDLTRIPVYAASGFLPSTFYWYVPILFPIAIAGSYVGRRIVAKIPQPTFRKIVLLAIALVSVKLVYDGIAFLAT